MSRGRNAPAAVNGGVLVVLLMLLAAVAVTAGTNRPPQVAEFAPQAVDRISDAPDGLSSEFGSGPTGDSVSGRAAPTPTVKASVPEREVPRVNRCVGSPPRQTEDPQSPPCVPDSSPTNSGASSQGVTADEILIAVPLSVEKTDDVQLLVDHFNSRYAFFGRKIKLRFFSPKGGAFGAPDTSSLTSDAVKVSEEIGAFASLAYPSRSGTEHIYYDELARRRVVSIDTKASLRTTADFQKTAPYAWSVLPDFTQQMRIFSSFVCRSLARRTAVHAGGTTATQLRKFGLLIGESSTGESPDAAPLISAMSGCGAGPAVTRKVSSDAGDATEGATIAAELRNAGVTSVICLCETAQLERKLMQGAAVSNYEPEWVLQAFQAQDYESSATNWPQGQARHAFGISFRNKLLPLDSSPWFWALREVDPKWEPDAQQGYNTAIIERYSELLLLASGIQLAGPQLTPATFARGLQAAKFPNPNFGRNPYFQAAVGFSQSDHGFYDDAAMIWWNPTATNYSANVSRGAFCYVGLGTRYRADNWPDVPQPFFDGACR